MASATTAPKINLNCPNCHYHIRDCLCFPESVQAKKKRKLSYNSVLTWSKMTKFQKFLTCVGYVFTGIIAFGCGISIAAAFVSLSILTGGAASYFIAAMLFVGGTIVNWLIYINAVPSAFVDMFGKEKVGQGLFEIPGACELLYVKAFEDARLMMSAPYAYIRCKSEHEDSLYFFDQSTGKRLELSLTPKALKDFDDQMLVPEKHRLRKLSYKELLKITQITGHRLLSKAKQGMMVLGFFLALAAGMMQSVLAYTGVFTLSNAFGFLAVISPAFPPLAAILAVVTVVSLTFVLLKNIAAWVKTPNVLQGFKNYYQELFDFTSPRCQLLHSDKVPEVDRLHVLPLKYNMAYVLVENRENNGQDKLFYVDKEHNKCFEVMTRKIEQVKQKLNQTNSCDLSFNDLADIAKLISHKTKSHAQVITARVLTILLTIIALPLAALGVFMTMNACAAATKVFLLKTIPRAAVAVVDTVSKILGLGLAFLGRISFTFRNIIRTIAHFFDTALDKKPWGIKKYQAVKGDSIWKQMWGILKNIILYFLCLINAIGNGLIALVGADRTAGPAWGAAIGTAGTINSLSAGVASGLLGNQTLTSTTAPAQVEKAIDELSLPRNKSMSVVKHSIFPPVMPIIEPAFRRSQSLRMLPVQ